MNKKNELKIGLNIKSKTNFALGKRKVNVFEQDDDEEASNHMEAVNQQLKQQKTSLKQLELQEKAIEEDSNVFEYDSVYDDLKRIQNHKKLLKDGVDEEGRKKARYMEKLIKTSQQRKQYLQQSKEKKLKEERDREIELYGEKEEFVTETYKKNLEEMRILQEKEKQEELLEFDPSKRDVVGFYKNMLSKIDDKVTLDTKNTQEILQKIKQEEELIEREKKLQQQKIEQEAILVNENQEVVDKRQLLTGGLNLTAKSIIRKKQEEKDRELREQEERKKREEERLANIEYMKRREIARKQRERNKDYVQEQQKQVQVQAIKEKETKEKDLIEKLTTKVSDNVVMDAKARYLARKKKSE
ncbi:hypothetical protein HDV06_003455 [Boothiomyces sp. JEL0866]|nr:hypothetical protein HDV06_003455 [Boothiomyces sp. JEL0866]